jgi:gliding motility-associated-like protein
MKNLLCSLLVGFLVFFLADKARAQLNAGFSANITSGCESSIVMFADQSTASPTSWQWDFGDGSTTSSLQNPVHFYANTGTYTVTLNVANSSGTAVETKTNYITIHENPIVEFSLPDTVGCIPYSAVFSDATVVAGGSVVSWNWDFGDGNTSNLENPLHIYNSENSFHVLLSVTDNNGCSNNLNKIDYVTTFPSPTSLFSQNNSFGCSLPLELVFTNNSTGTGLVYAWSFGNGNTSNLLTPADQTFTALGTFANTLMVTNSDGCSDTSSQALVIAPFVADFSQDTTAACVNEAINFTDLSTTIANTWNWDFGDGTTSSAQNPSHGYNVPGTYTVELIAAGPIGCSGNVIKTNLITINPPPTVGFTADDTGACQVPFVVNFTDNTPNAVSWNWNFGDGNTSTNENPVNTYTSLGNYTVSLTVIDINGCSATLVESSFIQIIPPTVNFNSIKTNGCAPLVVDFNDLTFSNETITSWNWNFGNGNTSTSQSPTETYTDTGSYDVTLIIVNADGCTDSLTFTDFIQVGQLPIVNFSPTDTTGCHPFTVSFYDSSSVYSDQWSWNFGDGETSLSQDPTHIYIDTGYFEVTYAAGFHGCWDTLRIDSVVEVLLPKAEFTVSPNIGCNAPHTVTFTDGSEGSDNWTWRFGDGLETTTQNPIHTYTNTGFFTAKLIVENFTTGCLDSITQVISISDREIGFDQSDTVVCKNFAVQFTDETIVNSTISSWSWDFGDGGLSSAQHPNYTYTTSGIYDVRLIITDALGCLDTLIKTNTVDVKSPSVADFVADTTFGCAPLLVNFSDLSIPVNPILEWTWDFGDGGSDTLQHPTYVYSGRGVFNVTLTIVDTFGCVGVLTKNSYIRPTIPYPGFSFTPTLCNNDSVLFTNTSTGSDMTYVWNYGDGSPGEVDVSPFHTYFTNADTSTLMSVMLTVTDSNGCDSSITQDLTISIPVAYFGADSLIGSCPPHLVTFSDSSSTDVVNWTWSFGDNSSTSNLEDPNHTYTSVGNFNVSLLVENDVGCFDTLTIQPMITVNGPSGDFSSVTTPFTCFKEVVFESNTINTDSIYFIFGDGGANNGDTVNHAYASPGNYTVVMTMSDATGCSVNFIGNHNVGSEAILSNHYHQGEECTGLPFVFHNYSSSDSPIVSWLWEFGDGESVLNTTNVPAEHIFTQGGEMTSYLTVTSTNGCKDVSSKPIIIPESINVYNVFTPNNDGLNDVFEVETCSVLAYDIQIFDRWGIRVFDSKDKLIHWDGKRNGGKQAENGTYFYRINATSSFGTKFKKKGSITLLN